MAHWHSSRRPGGRTKSSTLRLLAKRVSAPDLNAQHRVLQFGVRLPFVADAPSTMKRAFGASLFGRWPSSMCRLGLGHARFHDAEEWRRGSHLRVGTAGRIRALRREQCPSASSFRNCIVRTDAHAPIEMGVVVGAPATTGEAALAAQIRLLLPNSGGGIVGTGYLFRLLCGGHLARSAAVELILSRRGLLIASRLWHRKTPVEMGCIVARPTPTTETASHSVCPRDDADGFLRIILASLLGLDCLVGTLRQGLLASLILRHKVGHLGARR